MTSQLVGVKTNYKSALFKAIIVAEERACVVPHKAKDEHADCNK